MVLYYPCLQKHHHISITFHNSNMTLAPCNWFQNNEARPPSPCWLHIHVHMIIPNWWFSPLETGIWIIWPLKTNNCRFFLPAGTFHHKQPLGHWCLTHFSKPSFNYKLHPTSHWVFSGARGRPCKRFVAHFAATTTTTTAAFRMWLLSQRLSCFFQSPQIEEKAPFAASKKPAKENELQHISYTWQITVWSKCT